MGDPLGVVEVQAKEARLPMGHLDMMEYLDSMRYFLLDLAHAVEPVRDDQADVLQWVRHA